MVCNLRLINIHYFVGSPCTWRVGAFILFGKIWTIQKPVRLILGNYFKLHLIMPIKKYMLNVDGKDHQVSEKNIEKYGIESYAKNYPGATIRMRDDKDSDYDIPINEYQRAVDSGLKPLVSSSSSL